jgi:hypothetical protein
MLIAKNNGFFGRAAEVSSFDKRAIHAEQVPQRPRKTMMNQEVCSSRGRNRFAILALVLALMGSLALVAPAQAQITIVRISLDKFTNSDSVHKSEVEPATFSWGSTIVSAYHVGRRPGSVGWGSADIGFSTSTNGGKTWSYGYLPGITVNYQGGTFGAAADPSVAYDAKHGQWLISSLPLVGLNGFSGKIGDVGVSRSTDGLHWGNLILIDNTALDDKNWTVCDNTTTSPFYGNCYTEWDQAFGSGDILMSVSSDGGLTWGPGKSSADQAGGLGGEPLVQPNGTVIVPFAGGGVDAITSTDGGKTWGTSVFVANVISYFEPNNFRNPDLPSAAIDGAGKVFVAWSDCRFRTGCKSNDIVFSTTTDGKTWTSPVRIPIDPTTSKVDHVIPGIGIDPATSGSTAHITVVYYYFAVAGCTDTTCQLDVGFTTSTDGGATWTAGKKIAGPMNLTWLPDSDIGWMVADYIGVSYNAGNPFGVFALAKPKVGNVLAEAMYTTTKPLILSGDEPRYSSQDDQPVPGAQSNHEMIFYYDDEGQRPIPPSRWIKNPNAQ